MGKQKKIKLVIAGSRTLEDYGLIQKAIDFARIDTTNISEVVSGNARGIDQLGESWADNNGIKVKKFPADWNRKDVPEKELRTRSDGSKYWFRAGFARNEQMAKYGDVLLAIIDLDSETHGTDDMVNQMKKQKKPYYVYEVGEKIDF